MRCRNPPMVFTKPTHALVPMDGREIELPGGEGEVQFQLEIVLRAGRDWEPGIREDELFDAMALGLDLTLRDVQSKLKEKGHPWLAAKGFRHSAPIGPWLAYPGRAVLETIDFSLLRGTEVAQLGNARDMIFPVDVLAEHIGSRYGLRSGNLIFTGTPAGVAAVRDGEELVANGMGSRLLLLESS